jgi:succinoglycan biosynthesis protein ExoV
MKLWYYRGEAPNFGDDLNMWLWPKVLPRQFDEDSSMLFLGIGSILFNRFEKSVRKIVFGSGFGGYSAAPDMHDGTWQVRFVRGPQTARLMKLDPKLALADPAILIRAFLPPPAKPGAVVSFMPHWESMERGNWPQACDMAGVNLIDPRRPVEEVLAELQRSRLVIAEAMHGAIVADALRIPWIATAPIHERNRMKWADWASSLDIALRPQRLLPSSLIEAQLSLPRHRLLRGGLRVLQQVPGASLAETLAIRIAARGLRRLSTAEPTLSPDAAIDRTTTRLLEEVHRFQRDFPVLEDHAPATRQ